MFQFSGFASLARWCTFSTPGCPIRKSRDILCICHSPWLIAAYHVLLSLQDPRHPPYALNYFLFSCANYGATYLYSLLRPQMSEGELREFICCLFLVSFSICQRTTLNSEFRFLNAELRLVKTAASNHLCPSSLQKRQSPFLFQVKTHVQVSFLAHIYNLKFSIWNFKSSIFSFFSSSFAFASAGDGGG